MKKLVYSLAVLFSVALVSCGGHKDENKDSANDSAADTTVVVAESDTTVVVADSVAPAADSAADSAK